MRNRDPLSHTLRTLVYSLKWSFNIYTKNLVQTHAGPAHAASVTAVHMSFYHGDLEGLVFLVSAITSGSYTLFAFSSRWVPEPWGEGFSEDLSWTQIIRLGWQTPSPAEPFLWLNGTTLKMALSLLILHISLTFSHICKARMNTVYSEIHSFSLL